jgi:ABC-type phosphate transport system ATPase subunit
VRLKEARIAELLEERRGLQNVRRNFEKQLVRDRKLREQWPETVNSLQKDVRVYQFRLRRLKIFIENLRKREREQGSQIESLANQNRELLQRAHLTPEVAEDLVEDASGLLSRKKRRRCVAVKLARSPLPRHAYHVMDGRST